MSMTDPIADLLTRIRNAQMAKHTDRGPAGLEDEGAHRGDPQGRGLHRRASRWSRVRRRAILRVRLKYGDGGERAITGLERVSRPGRRVYCGKDEIPKVLDGLG